jgi:ribosomal protein S18 acetylase RimI-like enzyme
MSTMPDPTIRRATEADLEALVDLLADDEFGRQREDPSRPLDAAYRAAFRELDADPNQVLVVLDLAGEPIGCLQITIIAGLAQRGSRRGQIEEVRIASARRNRGLGKWMLEHAVEECRKRGCSIVQLTTNKLRIDARRFYEQLGFVASHEGMKLTLELPDRSEHPVD